MSAQPSPPPAAQCKHRYESRNDMRLIEIAFWVLAVSALIAWVIFYFLIQCGLGPPGRCAISWPWQLRGEDFTFLIVAPGSAVAGLVGMAWLISNRDSRLGQIVLAVGLWGVAALVLWLVVDQVLTGF